MTIRILTIGAMISILTACSGGHKPLHNMQGVDGGADEFNVLPTAPLEMPASYSALPTPTPGAPNRVDPTPNADAIAALGGRASALQTGGVPASDSALVSVAARNGVDPTIRQMLASEDAAYRRGLGRGLFGGLFGGNRYFATYAAMKLDAYAELARLRAAGVETPTAPPAR